MRKHVFGVCDQVRLKPACTVTEARQMLEILAIETLADAQADLHLCCSHMA